MMAPIFALRVGNTKNLPLSRQCSIASITAPGAIGGPASSSIFGQAVSLPCCKRGVATAGGTVRAQQLLICSNAYTELFPLGTDLHRRVVPVSTSVITTAPLPDALLRALLPQGHLVSDTRHWLNYFRIAPGNRLLFGGRGSLTGRESPEVYHGLERRLFETFPVLEGVALDHRWSGKVAVTLDDLPL